MTTGLTLYVDESGEAGIKKVRVNGAPGASPYMTLGAALIADRHRADFEATLHAIREEIRKKHLHCSELNHYQILHYCRRLMSLEMTLFGVISRKDTLGQYKERIDGDSHKYFNKCVQYLLERVGWYMEAYSIPKSEVAIVFEKANRDYGRMENFLWQVQSTPLQPMAKKLSHLDVSSIEARDKGEESLLKVADLVAHALFRCVDKRASNMNICEPRYLRELGPKFFGNPTTCKVTGAGLYCVHQPSHLKLDQDVEVVVRELTASSREG